MSKKTGGPAFPGLHPSKECTYKDSGMTLRDYFAAKAMQGIYASPTVVRFADGTTAPQELTNQIIAQIAYEQADAMIAERDCER